MKKIHGIITRISAYREVDRILSVFTREQGRMRIIAKGVRKITSRRGGHLDLLNEVSMEIEETGAKTGLGPFYLREVHVKNNFRDLKANPSCFSSACLVVSFLDRILPEHAPYEDLFCLTQDSFRALSDSENPAPVLLTFFLKTLRTLGHIPNTLPKDEVRQTVWKALMDLDPQLTLNARRTLGMFSSLESSRSS